MEGWFPPVEDEITAENMYVKTFLLIFMNLCPFYQNRTNLLLSLGVVILGMAIPFLQILLAYIYFKKNHIWSRILNDNLSDRILEGALCKNTNLQKIKHMLKGRTMY